MTIPSTWEIIKQLKPKDIWQMVKDSAKMSKPSYSLLNPVIFNNDFQRIFQENTVMRESNDNNSDSHSYGSPFVIQLIYLCLNNDDPIGAVKEFLPTSKTDYEAMMYKNLFLTTSVIMADALLQNINEQAKAEEFRVNAYNDCKNKAQKQYDNLQIVIEYLTKKRSTLLPKPKRGNNGSSSTAEEKPIEKTFKEGLYEKLDKFISANKIVDQQAIEKLEEEIIKIYEKHHFFTFGFIKDNKLCWTENVKQFGFVVYSISKKNVFPDNKQHKMFVFLKSLGIIEFSEKNWNSVITAYREIANSDYASPNLNSLQYQPIDDNNQAVSVVISLINSKSK